MNRKIFKYDVKVDWEKEHQGFLGGGFKQIPIACPPEFGGPGGIISPEDLFVASNSVCVMTTFLDFCEKARIALVSYESQAEGKMEFIDDFYRFSEIIIKPTIVVAQDSEVERTKRLMDKAHKICPVGKSSTCEIIIEPIITSEK